MESVVKHPKSVCDIRHFIAVVGLDCLAHDEEACGAALQRHLERQGLVGPVDDEELAEVAKVSLHLIN
jgi:hypothetical protein